MRARKYTKVFEIWQTEAVSDGYGGNTVSDTLITKSWANIETVANNSKHSQRLTSLGITDPTKAIIARFRLRNDITYNAINQYLLYRGDKYIIQNNPSNIDFNDTEVEIIAVKQATK